MNRQRGTEQPGHGRAARHTIEEHTGELRIGLRATTLRDLFEEAARALAKVIGDRDPSVPPIERRIRVRASDCDALLVAWLNELIFETEQTGRIFGDTGILVLSGTELEAVARGSRLGELRTQVKAATLHGLRVQLSPEGYTASVILDV